MILRHHNDYEDAYWWNNISSEIECKGEIECYDKVMESYQNYPVVIYTYILKYKQMLKNFVSTKMKSLRNIINILMIFIILLWDYFVTSSVIVDQLINKLKNL